MPECNQRPIERMELEHQEVASEDDQPDDTEQQQSDYVPVIYAVGFSEAIRPNIQSPKPSLQIDSDHSDAENIESNDKLFHAGNLGQICPKFSSQEADGSCDDWLPPHESPEEPTSPHCDSPGADETATALHKAIVEQPKAQLEEHREAPSKTESERDQQQVDRAFHQGIITPWKSVFDHQQVRYQVLEARYDKLFSEAEKIYEGWPELDRENRKLSEQLTRCREHSERLAKQVDEYQTERIMSDQRHNQLEKLLEKERKDKLRYIEEYHDRMPQKDPDWWSMEGLRSKIQGGEKQLKDTVGRLEMVEREKQKAYRSIERLLEEQKGLREESREPKLYHPQSQPEPDKDDSPWNPKMLKVDGTKRMPWSESSEARKVRRKVMDEYREKQSMVRQEQKKAREMMEKVRQWNMGTYYPPLRSRWDKSVEKTSWERWEGERWTREAANANETSQVRTIKRKILI